MEKLPIEIHYNKVFGGIMVGCSVFILLVAFAIGKPFPQAITGGILLLVGFGFMTQPAFVVAEGEVQMRNLLGMTLKRHEFKSLEELSVRDGKLWLGEKAVGSARWLLSGADWERLERAIDGAKTR